MKEGRELLVGFVMISAVFVAVVGSLWLQGSNFGRPTRSVQALLASVGQLTEGNAVTYRGVRIGSVDAIEVEPGGASVRLSLLLRESIGLPDDAAVVLGPESLFGRGRRRSSVGKTIRAIRSWRFQAPQSRPGTRPLDRCSRATRCLSCRA